jgi:hypothetical protein
MFGSCSSPKAEAPHGCFSLVLGADVVYPRPGLPAALAAAALAHLAPHRGGAHEPGPRLLIMQHGSYHTVADSQAQPGAAAAAAEGGKPLRRFHTRDGWDEFVAILREAGEVVMLPYRLLSDGAGGGEDGQPATGEIMGSQEACGAVPDLARESAPVPRRNHHDTNRGGD